MKQLLIAFSLIGLSLSSYAQDRNFSQFYASPLTFNPALTGAFEGRHRAVINYRNQWQSILPRPFTTIGAGFDMNFKPQKIQMSPNKVGVGLTIFSDKVGPGSFSTNEINFSGAFHKALNREGTHYLSGGVQGGIHQKTLAYDALTFNDQFDGSTGYILVSGEVLPANSFTFGDLAAGLNWSYTSRSRTTVYAGISAFHITRPDVSFYQEETGIETSNLLAMKINAHFGLQLPIGEGVSVQPRVVAYRQGSHFEVNGGANLSISFSEYSDGNFIVGGWFRPVTTLENSMELDAVVLLLGVQLSGFQVGASYDINVSQLSSVTSGRGAFELSLMYIGSYENETVICPTF